MKDSINVNNVSDETRLMLSYCTNMYHGPHVLSLFESLANEITLYNDFIKSLKRQVDIDTATWSLDYYEKQYGITEKKATIEERRKIVKVAMQRKTPMTARKMESLIKNLTNFDTKIIEHTPSDFLFEIEILEDGKNQLYIGDVYKMVKKYKPSHLAFKMYTVIPSLILLEVQTEQTPIYPTMCGTGVICGMKPQINIIPVENSTCLMVDCDYDQCNVMLPIVGTLPYMNTGYSEQTKNLVVDEKQQQEKKNFAMAGEIEVGTDPITSVIFDDGDSNGFLSSDSEIVKVVYKMCGQGYC